MPYQVKTNDWRRNPVLVDVDEYITDSLEVSYGGHERPADPEIVANLTKMVGKLVALLLQRGVITGADITEELLANQIDPSDEVIYTTTYSRRA